MIGPQLALAGPPLALLTAGLLWTTRSWAPARRALALLAWLVVVWLTFFAGYRPAPSHMIQGAPDSSELWTFTLQSPEQRIERRQPVGTFASDATLVARYVWDRATAPDYRAGATVMARVNDTALAPATAADDPAEYWCCALRWRVPAAIVQAAPTARLELWLPARDHRVRFVAQRSTAAAVLRQSGALFFDGAVLRAGAPHTYVGSIRTGFPHVWLGPGP